MNWQSVAFDWNQARAFLATVEEGTLSGAARVLGLTQPTLSRQITALEKDLGVTLFERGRRAMTLTQPGLELLDHVRAMGDAATAMSLAASGQAQSIEGVVAITATDSMSTYHLPAILRKLRDIAPNIEIELIAANTISDLTRREADIAIRHARPEQSDLIAKLIGETTGHFYAATDYLDRVGRPETMEQLSTLDFIGIGRTEEMITALNGLGLTLTKDNYKLNTRSGPALIELTRQGLGVCVLTKDTETLFPDLERVLPEIEPIPVPIWLVTHRELHTSRRIRLVFDLLAEELGKL